MGERMSYNTKKGLEAELIDQQERMRTALLDKGKAGGSNDWHDNFALEDAQRREDNASIRIGELQNLLYEPEIIEPRRETHDVGIGNTVVLRFEGEEEGETFHLLGKADAMNSGSNISYESPIGRSILGRTKGESITIQINSETEQDVNATTVQIIDILPGNF